MLALQYTQFKIGPVLLFWADIPDIEGSGKSLMT